MTSNNFTELYPWITNKFFQKILQSDQNNNNIKVQSILIKAALGKGENYTSQMLRVKVTYTTDTTTTNEYSFVVKATVPNPEVAAIFKEMGLFKIEVSVYQNILPKVEKLLKSIGDNTQLSAK